MDLEKRREELENVRNEFSKIRELRKVADEAIKRWEEANANKKENDANDEIHVNYLKNQMDKANANLNEQINKMKEMKNAVEKGMLEEIGQELSSYRGNAVGDPNQNLGKLNADRNEQAMRTQHTVWRNEEKLNELKEELAKAEKESNYAEMSRIGASIAGLEVDIKHGKDILSQLRTPYKSIEDNQNEYEALYALKKEIEKMQGLNERHFNEQGFNAEIKALDALIEVREDKIPIEDRYKDAKEKRTEAKGKKDEILATINTLKAKLQAGEIGKDYVQSVKERIEELSKEAEMYKKQEEKYAEKMTNLEKKDPKVKNNTMTPMEQYQQLEAVVQQSVLRREQLNQKIVEIETKLQADPDNEQLKNEKARLTNEWNSLKEKEDKANKKLDELAAKLNIDRGGQGQGQDQGQQGQGQDQGQQGQQGQGQQGQGQQQGQQGQTPTGGALDVINGNDHYKGLNFLQKWQLKREAYKLREGEEPKGFLTNLAIMLPNEALADIAKEAITTGEIKIAKPKVNEEPRTEQSTETTTEQRSWWDLSPQERADINANPQGRTGQSTGTNQQEAAQQTTGTNQQEATQQTTEEHGSR